MRRSFGAAALVVAVALLAGCGGEDGSEPTAVSLSVSKSASGTGYELSAPESIEAGVAELSLQVDTPSSEQHEAQLIRVEDGHSLDEVLAVFEQEGGSIPSWMFAGGGVGTTAGGKTATVTQVLQPGTYYVVDIGEDEGDDVPSYAEQGATATIEVTGERSDDELPDADATITAEDHSFSTEGLVAGVNRVLFENSGEELHHVIALPYVEGATLDQVTEFVTSDDASGPPPVAFEKAVTTAVLEGGDAQITELALEAGKYALICFISDRAGGPPHVAKGMIAEVVIE